MNNTAVILVCCDKDITVMPEQQLKWVKGTWTLSVPSLQLLYKSKSTLTFKVYLKKKTQEPI